MRALRRFAAFSALLCAAAVPALFTHAPLDSGLDFRLNNGASAEKHQIETMAGGVGVIDFNSDGLPDIYFANGARLPSLSKDAPEFHNRLYQNLGGGRFRDVTAKAGVQGRGFCTGVAVADYDNDGHQDIFVCCMPENVLYRNRGDGTFMDVTKTARLDGPFENGNRLWSLAAGWLDYDNDGHLDLFLSNYCDWRVTNNPVCAGPNGERFYCAPRRFKAERNALYRNNGDGTFKDVSEAAGIAQHRGYGMGVAFADYNRDGFTDIFVANDTARNLLFENDRNGKFIENALLKGVAFREDARTISGMGADFRDFDDDGFPDLFVTALASETWPLFRNIEGRGFREITLSSGTGKHSMQLSGWSNAIYDFDNDGHKDLVAAGSHAMDNSDSLLHVPYLQSNALFLNTGRASFRDASSLGGAEFVRPKARRGCALADFNGDGAVDVVTSVIGQRAELFLGSPAPDSHWIGVRFVGKASNRDGLGAAVKLVDSAGTVQYNHATTSVGYASSSDRQVHFGLGRERQVRELEIRWPSGVVQTVRDLAADRVHAITETGAAKTAPLWRTPRTGNDQ